MKIIITENQFEDVVLKYVKKSFKDKIIDVFFSGKMLEIILPGEESFKSSSVEIPSSYFANMSSNFSIVSKTI